MITTSIRATGRLLTCAALALGLTGLSATVARAHDPEVSTTREVNNEWEGTDFSPCTGEMIDLKGKEVNVTKQKPPPTGTQSSASTNTFFKFTSQQSGTGTGQDPTPNHRYKYSNSFENEFRTSTCKFTFSTQTMKKINRVDSRQGRYDWFLHHKEMHKFDSGAQGCRLIQVDHVKTKSGCK